MSRNGKSETSEGKAGEIKNIRECSVGDGISPGLHVFQNRPHLFATEFCNLEH